jgi:tripartite-type tricarboxylate transporter receptor subunit TctC
MNTFARIAAALLASLLTLAAAPASAQQWPQRPVRFIVPLGAGSGTDISARLVGERLSQRWGQPIVIENRPGGDSFVAISSFLGANDDHTLLYAGMGTFTAHPYLHDKLPYDPADIVPVAGVSHIIVAIAVPESLTINTLSELVALARAQPGKLNSAAVPGVTDFIFSGFLKNAGLEMARVPYRDINLGVGDLAEGRLQVIMVSLSMVLPQLHAGKVKLLAVTSRERVAVVPDVPTVGEAGYPMLGLEGLVGLYGLKTMPAELRERIAADVKAALADPTIVERLTATGQVVSPGSAAEFAASIEKQSAGMAGFAKVLGIQTATTE